MGGGEAATGTTIRAAIFDYGGVLTTPGRAAIAQWTRQEGIHPETFSAVLKAWLSRKAPVGTPIHRLETGDISIAEFNRELAARLRTIDDQPVPPDGLIERMFHHMRPDPAMQQLVRELGELGLRTVLLSNSWGNSYPRRMLAELFEFTVISGEVGLRKPDPEIYRHTLNRLEIAEERTVFVDDAAPNIETAQRLGLHTVSHADPATTRRQLASLIPGLAVEDTRRAEQESPRGTEAR